MFPILPSKMIGALTTISVVKLPTFTVLPVANVLDTVLAYAVALYSSVQKYAYLIGNNLWIAVRLKKRCLALLCKNF